MIDTKYKTFARLGGRRLRFVRKDSNITLLELATRVDISVNTLSSYEQGKSLPNLFHLSIICQFFNINPYFLYYELFNSERSKLYW